MSRKTDRLTPADVAKMRALASGPDRLSLAAVALRFHVSPSWVSVLMKRVPPSSSQAPRG